MYIYIHVIIIDVTVSKVLYTYVIAISLGFVVEALGNCKRDLNPLLL